MNRLSDLLIGNPLPEALLRGLLFTSFTLHMLLVLLTLGTAILALYYFIDSQYGGRAKVRFDKRIIKTFMAHKSLAVVLGVAPLPPHSGRLHNPLLYRCESLCPVLDVTCRISDYCIPVL